MIPVLVPGHAVAKAFGLGTLPATTPDGLALARRIRERIQAVPQVPIATHHVLHAGVYHRTICIPAGVALAGARIKIPTTVVVSGHASVLLGDGDEAIVRGYEVLPAPAGREQIFIAHADTYVTMSFRTQAASVEEAEGEFTDEADLLMSRTGENTVVVTGD